jgi:WD40 repeat protein
MGQLAATIAIAALASILLTGCPRAGANRGATSSASSHAGEAQGAISFAAQLGHTDGCAGVLSPNGTHVLTSSFDTTLKLWEVETGALLRTFHDGDPVYSVAFSPDGNHAVSGNGKGVLRLWDLATGQSLHTFGRHGEEHAASAVAFSSDGHRILSVSEFDPTITLWDADTGREVRSIQATKRIDFIAFSPDGARALTRARSYGAPDAEPESLLRLWDLESGTSIPAFAPMTRTINAVDYSLDGKTIIAATHDSEIAIWDATNGKKKQTLAPWRGAIEGHPLDYKTDVSTVALSPDGNRALVAVRLDDLDARPGVGPTQIYLYDVESGALLRTFRGNTTWGASVAFTPNGRFGICGSEIWDLTTFALVRSFPELHPDRIQSLTFSNDGRWLLSASRADRKIPNALRVWDLKTGALAHSFGSTGVATAAFVGDSQVLAAEEGTMKLWDIATGRVVHEFEAQTDWFSSVIVTADGKRAVTADNAGSVLVWDLPQRRIVLRVALKVGAIDALAVSADGTRALTGAWSRPVIHVIDLATGDVVGGYDFHDSYVKALAFSPDGKLAASGSWDKTVKIWDPATGQVLHTLVGHSQYVNAVAFSSDGSRLISGGYDNVVRVWDVASGKSLDALAGHANQIATLAVSPAGKLAASGSWDGTLRAWNLDATPPTSVAFAAAGDEWIAYSDDGYFDASRDGGRLAAAVQGQRGFFIDQLAVRNNRPDILLDRLGLGATDAMAHFRARHTMRLRKLGLAEEQLASRFVDAPEATIVDLVQHDKTAALTFDLTAKGGDLRAYQVFVNAVPLYGAAGKPTTGHSQHVTETIELTSGPNKVEVSAVESGGAESLRAARTIDYAKPVIGDLYVLAFGVSRYKNSKYDLGFPHKDALDLAEVMKATAGKVFKAVHVATYVNEQATVDAVKAAKSFFAPATVDDTVVVFVGGHGVHTRDAAAEYYYATYEVDVRDLPHTAANFELIEDLMQGIAPRRKLFLMDTCESGERDDEEGQPDDAVPMGARGLRARATRALVLDAKGASSQRAAPRPFVFDRDRFIENDLSRRSGAIVFSSSRGAEFSYELDALKNGVFTKEVVRALVTNDADTDQDGLVSTDELRTYVEARVPKVTDGKQHPTVDRDNLDVKFAFPLVPSARSILTRADPLAAAGR